MPRDQRLFITIPIDFHRHPKVRRLPVEIRWTFLEMNFEAKIADNDGRFSAQDAEFMWPVDHLTALVASHPARPLLIRDAETGEYVIREYAEHQQTRAERERLAAVSRENGRKGGRPRQTKPNPDETQSGSVGTQSDPAGTRRKAESRVQSPETSKTYQSQSSSNRASDETDEETARRDELCRQTLTAGFRIDPDRLIGHIEQRTARTVDAAGAMRVATMLLDKGGDVKNPQAYVLSSITRSWAEVQKYIDASP